MTNHPPLLPISALLVPVAVAIGFAWGPATAGTALLSSVVVLLNLKLLSVLGPRLVRAVAEEDPLAALWGLALVAKFLLIAILYVGFARTLPPIGLVLGFLPLVGGTLLTALVLAQAEAASDAGGEAA